MRLLLFIFFLITFYRAEAQQESIVVQVDTTKKQQKATHLKLDSSKTAIKKFDDQAIQKYKEKKEFQYDDEVPKQESWWDRFWRKLWKWLNNLFRSSEKAKPNPLIPVILKYTLLTLSAGLLIFVIFKLFGLDFKLFFGKSKEVEVPYDESLENIHEINFDEQLEAALQNGNYRLAVRLLYLKTLKLLSDRELINWQPDKTNQAYLAELQGQPQYEGFTELTYQFEYVWYGDFDIDQANFLQVQQSFQQFNEAVR